MKHHAFPAECPRCHAPVLATQWDFSDLMPTHGTRRADPVENPPPTSKPPASSSGRPTYNLHRRAGRPHSPAETPNGTADTTTAHPTQSSPPTNAADHSPAHPTPRTRHHRNHRHHRHHPLLRKAPDMAKISPKLVDETVTTSGYRITRASTVVHITDTHGTTIGEGTHTVSAASASSSTPSSATSPPSPTSAQHSTKSEQHDDHLRASHRDRPRRPRPHGAPPTSLDLPKERRSAAIEVGLLPLLIRVSTKSRKNTGANDSPQQQPEQHEADDPGGDVDEEQELRIFHAHRLPRGDTMTNQKAPVQGGVPEEQIEAAARALACLEPGEDWPTNGELGGSPTGTRDDEYRTACAIKHCRYGSCHGGSASASRRSSGRAPRCRGARGRVRCYGAGRCD
ncbi:hypothetical protein SAMN04488565_2627 [Leucobacter chromiiresistens]|uniref:Uncharacterized protein n=1 Tax=Leucobacter chromiiresistens TaxID=1079994 RepID=A0A1H1B775_9MICO|nr:hypothetical protein SAMN04488565_2627 [Leucobacter chromiiresistens]